MTFHHIGIATDDIEKLKEKLCKYLKIIEISETIYDKNQDAFLCMLTLEDNVKIELVSGNIVERLLKKRQYLYHTCYSVRNIDKIIEKLQKDGAFLVSEPKKAVLFNNKKVAFLMWDLGLIELLEESDDKL